MCEYYIDEYNCECCNLPDVPKRKIGVISKQTIAITAQ